MTYTKEQLIAFEDKITDLFNQGKIRSPVHLSGGDEKELIKIFEKIKPNDIVYSNYRSHYHALLHGVDEKWLFQWIMDNKSIHVHHKNPDLLSSAIVGGCLPIALGTALALKLKYEEEQKNEKRNI